MSELPQSLAHRKADHLVIGGGLAGSMVGLCLAASGRDVLLLERERTAHHKVCGEFLSREAVDCLNEAGVNPIELGAESIRFLRLTSKMRVVETVLPFTALSISRCVLDEALLARAAQAGCTVERGAFVEGLERRGGLWHAQLRSGECCSAPTVFLANGKHDLRCHERAPGPHGDMVGFKLHWRLTPQQTADLRGAMELYLFHGGYGGLSLVEGGVANFCLAVKRAALRKIGGWPDLLASIQNENPHIAERLRGALPLWQRPLAVSSIPYGYLAGRPCGLWCVGDQAAVIPSFTGDGMSIALHSALLAARMYLGGASADEYHRSLQAHLRRGMRLATTISRAMITDAGRALAPVGLAIFPGAMKWIARSTRIPEKALKLSLSVRGAERKAAIL